MTYIRKNLVELQGVDMDEYPIKGLDFPNRDDFPDLPLSWWKHNYLKS